MSHRLTGIHFYPIKSVRGLSPQSRRVTPLGFELDRRWMLVDEQGKFITQRQQHRMALIETVLEGPTLVVSAPGMSDLRLDLDQTDGAPVQTQVWDDQVLARSAGPEATHWFSAFLGSPVRLVQFPQSHLRQVDMTYAQAGDKTAFSDGFPFLLIGEASLEDLNSRLDAPLPMRRFRPNLVVSGSLPYAEDRWRRIRIGAVEFRVVKPCSRCIITTIDPETAERGPEPLRTLMGYRRRDNKIYFGQNLIHDGIGTLSLGDSVEILEQSHD